MICGTNQHQLYVGASAYASDYNDYLPKNGRHNNWGFNPDEQRAQTYLGMGEEDINLHDQWAVESMGEIYNRTQEHLGTSDLAILQRARQRLLAVLTEEWESRPQALPYESPHEALIMASVIEKESGLNAEKQRIAGVFIRRLEQGMRLQSDPTIIYGITKGQSTLGRGLRRSGLPPSGPSISRVSTATWAARWLTP